MEGPSLPKESSHAQGADTKIPISYEES